MEGIERLQRLYSIAKAHGVSKSKKEFSDQIGASYTTLVRTMNGEHYYSPDKYILAAEDMLRHVGIDPYEDIVTLASVMKELKEQRKLLEKLIKLTEKGHISDTQK